MWILKILFLPIYLPIAIIIGILYHKYNLQTKLLVLY